MSTSSLERQIRPIYDALDTGSNKSAIVACNKLLKKHPKNELIKALKGLALVRSAKVEEALVLCDEVLALKPTDDGVLTAMTHVLRGLGRHNDMIIMFEEAYKKTPTNEELGAQTFFANVRAGNWKSAQLVATRMYKQFQDERYLYWNIMGAVLQANEPSQPASMRTVLYKLAHRLITSAPTPSFASADRFHLHLSILQELELYDDACMMVDNEIGQAICSTSLACDEVRRNIYKRKGLLKEEGDLARRRITENKDRNWLEFLSILDATFAPITTQPDVASDEGKAECSRNIRDTLELFEHIKAEDGRKDRSASLALLELEKRSRSFHLSDTPSRMIDLMEEYVRQIGDMACCFEDMRPYLDLEGEELQRWTAFLQEQSQSFETISELTQFITNQKMLRYNLSSAEVSPEAEKTRATFLIQSYLNGLKITDVLKEGELNPSDDLALLAANTLISLWSLTNDDTHLYHLVCLLEFALTKSKHAFQVRLVLIQIYRLLGAPSSALEHYRAMNIKQIQHDTLSHLILSRAIVSSLASSGDLTFVTECMEASNIYITNSHETSDFTVRAFTMEKYSQIPEFVLFEDRLDNSLHRDLVKLEHVRMRYTHELISSDIIDLELIELKFIFERYHHDNRDFEILPNYQPKSQPPIHKQTHFLTHLEGLEWLRTFLKMYVRILADASDLDEVVEEKLLIGDRPKPNCDGISRVPLKDHKHPEGADEELTTGEKALHVFGEALSGWLRPYHNYARPSAAAVLADAAKQAALKGGQPLKGVEIPTNGSSTPNVKKDEEPPAVKEPPEIIIKYFDDMNARFKILLESRSRNEALHVANLAQEALLLIVIESLRFKAPSVVKINKYGALVQHLKTVRQHAITILKDIATELQKVGGEENGAQRKAIMDTCASLPLDHDFMLEIAKKITDSRKKVMEGIAKGMNKICTTYAQ